MSDKMNTLEDVFRTGLEYIYDAEKQLTSALPKMAEAASSPDLRQAFTKHQRETENHVDRLEQIFSSMKIQPQAKTNSVVQAMTHEAEQMINHIDASPLRDAALIVAGNQVEHFEMGSYGSLRDFAELLGYRDVVSLLEGTLEEEKAADKKLTEIAEDEVNDAAAEMHSQLTQ